NNVAPGQCWAFKGSSGCITIKLLSPIYVTSITLEHITVHESPNSKTTSAPRCFSVWGLKSINDKEGYFFGKFMYDNCASPIQNFPMKKKSNESYEIIELKIHSNSGNPNYTCLYRVRVHGELDL
ncbi:Similar to SUN2: SUN domain-containing protein 2 (Homo sapiens), partial [Cotesia congregata]